MAIIALPPEVAICTYPISFKTPQRGDVLFLALLTTGLSLWEHHNVHSVIIKDVNGCFRRGMMEIVFDLKAVQRRPGFLSRYDPMRWYTFRFLLGGDNLESHKLYEHIVLYISKASIRMGIWKPVRPNHFPPVDTWLSRLEFTIKQQLT